MNELERPCKAIIVDDDPMFLIQIEMALSELGIVSKTFLSGEEMFKALDRTTVDIFVIDFNLNGQYEDAMNGGEVVQALRLMSHTQPVIIMSSQAVPDVAVSLMQIGVTDYIEKLDSSLENLKRSVKNIQKVKEIDNGRAVLEQSYGEDKKRLAWVLSVAVVIGIAFTWLKW